MGLLGLVIVTALAASALFASAIAPYEPNAIDIPNRFAPPSADHPLGTDQLGRGSIGVGGVDVVGLSPRGLKPLRRKVAMMFQDPVGSLSPRFKVGRVVTEPMVIHGIPIGNRRNEAARLLELVGLDASFTERYPHELSGGQARRVGVARALSSSPELVVADEPTAGLDLSIQGELLNLLAELQERIGLAILIITHNLAVVRHISDRTIVMHRGEFLEQGPTEDLFRAPRHEYTRRLLSASRHMPSAAGEPHALS